MRNAKAKAMSLDAVWSALSEERWRSTNELPAEAGVDDSTLMRIVDFLVHWNFAEIRQTPTPHVRRKAGAMSPVDVLNILSAVNENREPTTISKQGCRLAERVACRTCGGRSLRAIGENKVECTKCLERQWYAIEGRSDSLDTVRANAEG